MKCLSCVCLWMRWEREKGRGDGGKDLDGPVDRRETPSVLSRTPLSDDITISKPCTEIAFLSCVDVFPFETGSKDKEYCTKVLILLVSCRWWWERHCYSREHLIGQQIYAVHHEKSTCLVEDKNCKLYIYIWFNATLALAQDFFIQMIPFSQRISNMLNIFESNLERIVFICNAPQCTCFCVCKNLKFSESVILSC